MMGIEPSERILLGRRSREGERAIADEVSARIHSLIKSHLVELGKDTSGWNTLYRDPGDDTGSSPTPKASFRAAVLLS